MYLLIIGWLLVGSYSPDCKNLSGRSSVHKPHHCVKVAMTMVGPMSIFISQKIFVGDTPRPLLNGRGVGLSLIHI